MNTLEWLRNYFHPVAARAPGFRFGPSIEPGDIIATTVPTDPISTTIRTVTQSRVSHISLCLEGRQAIEANELVSVFSLDRVGIRSRESVAVLRLKREDRRDICARVSFFARMRHGQPYWTTGAVRSVIAPAETERPPGAFCSELAARAYMQVGCPLLGELRPEETTPGDILAATGLLEDVTDSVLVPLDPAEAVGMECLDQNRHDLPSGLMTSMLELRVCQTLSAPFENLGVEAPRSFLEAQMFVLRDVTRNPERARVLDELLVAALFRARYFENRSRWFEAGRIEDSDALCTWLDELPAEQRRTFLPMARQLVDMYRARTDRLAGHRASWESERNWLAARNTRVTRLLAEQLDCELEVIDGMIADTESCIEVLEEFERSPERFDPITTRTIEMISGEVPLTRDHLLHSLPGNYIVRQAGGRAHKYRGNPDRCLLEHALRCFDETSTGLHRFEVFRRDSSSGCYEPYSVDGTGRWDIPVVPPNHPEAQKLHACEDLGSAGFDDFCIAPTLDEQRQTLYCCDGEFVIGDAEAASPPQRYSGTLHHCLDAHTRWLGAGETASLVVWYFVARAQLFFRLPGAWDHRVSVPVVDPNAPKLIDVTKPAVHHGDAGNFRRDPFDS